MDSAAGEEMRAARPRTTRRQRIIWLSAFGTIVVAFIATVIALNASLFSASGFVASYLGALERHDVVAALAMPGVSDQSLTAGDADAALLRRDALGPLSQVRVIDDIDEGDGLHRVTVEYVLEGARVETSNFIVRHTGPRMGFFSSWEFDRSPLRTLKVTSENAGDFEINGMQLSAYAGLGKASEFRVFVPGAYTLSHESLYLEAPPRTLRLTSPSGDERVTLDVRASKAFEEAATDELAAFLDDCATQQLLQPTGCPFGKTISNRIDGLPEWSIVHYPKLAIEPGEEEGTWLIPPVSGSAHLSVDVRSLFDGTVSRLDEDVTFTVSYLVTLPADGGITLTPQ